jgi:Uma2 family endonuclease
MTSSVDGTPSEEEPMTALVVPTGRPWTADDVSRLPEDFHYELLDGRLVVPAAPMPIHQNICQRLVQALTENGPDDVIVTIDQSVLVDSHNEPRPDVVVTRLYGADRTPVFASDVLLVAEVVSRSSRSTDRGEKLQLYARGGIPSYWIVDPLAADVMVTQFVLGADGVYRKRLETTELVVVDEPWEVKLDVPAWTRTRDAIRTAARSRG